MKYVTSVLLSLCLLAAANLGAATYYVDNENGNDDNAGTSEKTAWKSIGKVNQFALKPGDSVLFRRGGLWRGGVQCQPGEKGKPITYSTYGKGNRPVMMGSVPLDKESDWNKVPDSDNLWVTNRATFSDAKIPCDTIAQKSWHYHCDGEGKIKFDTVKNGNEKEYRLTCLNSGKTSPNIQLSIAPFRVEANKAFVLRFRAKASKPFTMGRVSLMMQYTPWYELGTHSWTGAEIGTEWKDYEIVFQVNKSDEKGRITFFMGNTFPKDCVLSFVPLEGYFADVISNGINCDVGNMILIEKGKNEKFAGFKRWSVKELKEEADYYYEPETCLVYFYCDVNPATRYQMVEAALKRHIFAMNAHVIIDGFTMTNGAAHGVGGGGSRANDVVIRNNDIMWIGGGHLYTRNGRCTRYGNGVEFYGGGRDCLVENNVFSEIYDVAMTIQGRGNVVNENIIWRNNIIHHCEQSYEIWFSEENSVIKNVVFENNTCVDAGYCWGHRQRPDKRGTHLLGYGLKTKTIDHTIRNNVFSNTIQNLIWYYNPRIGELKVDNNVWWDESMGTGSAKEKELFSWDSNKNKVSYEEYRRLTGNDSHSKIVKPVFADPDHYDYRILNKEEIGNAGAQLPTQP